MESETIKHGTSRHLGGLDPEDVANAFEAQSIHRIADASDPVTTVVDGAMPTVTKGLDGMQALIDQGMSLAQDTIALGRATAGDAIDRVEAYTRREPLNALLIAASAGLFVSVVMSVTMRRR